ncbi:GD14394 [Drosophila simulans]|uniref:GD14394 n=1 Tax=Drosophila simulans TaxID=7240 RepID=B4QRQ1_DROSI|nr:GD14394 [Drosophila simulans]
MEVLVGARQSITINNSSDNGDSKTTATAGAAAAKSQKDGNRMARMDGQMDRWDRRTDGAAQEIGGVDNGRRIVLGCLMCLRQCTRVESLALLRAQLHSIHGITIRNPLSEIRDP